MSIDLREQLRQRYGTPKPTAVSTPVQTPTVERAFVTHAQSGRTIITAPLATLGREVANFNPGFVYLRGRFVEADNPNRNGAYWTTEDLELGQATVAGGPLNWLHDEFYIVGTLLNAEMVTGEAASNAGVGNHIESTAAMWKFLFPGEAAVVERAALERRAYYSMECISREVQCLDTPGRPGCGESFTYADYDAGRACAHLNSRSSIRRFVDPLFLGGAIIVPPVEPGWAKAEVEVVRQAAAVTERAGLADDGALSRQQAEAMVARILTWANRS